RNVTETVGKYRVRFPLAERKFSAIFAELGTRFAYGRWRNGGDAMSHFPLWFVVPTDKTGTGDAADYALPIVFSSVEKMSSWFASRKNEYCWQVRLLDRDSASQTITELRTRGVTQIYAELDGASPQAMSIADLVLRLANG